MDYSQLPDEIIEKIATEHLDTFSQLVAFSGVHKSWRSAALHPHNRRRLPTLPGILATTTSDSGNNNKMTSKEAPGSAARDDDTNSHYYYRFKPLSAMLDDSNENLPPDSLIYSTISDLNQCHCLASVDGWLVLAGPGHPLTIFLLNPLTGSKIKLPPLPPIQHEFDLKCAVLSSSPEDDDDGCHLIIVSHKRRLSSGGSPLVAWCKLRGGGGARRWKFVKYPYMYDVRDAIYIGGDLYILEWDMGVHVLHKLLVDTNLGTNEARWVPFSSAITWPQAVWYENWVSYHMLELNGELVVTLWLCERDANSVTFKVYKLLPSALQGRGHVDGGGDDYWEQVTSLDEHAFFVGTHQSVCIPAAKKNKMKMIKGDHIYYYIDHCAKCVNEQGRPYWGGQQVGNCGVFSMKEQKLVERSRLPDNYHHYNWFFPFPWDIGDKHSKMQTKMAGNVTNACFMFALTILSLCTLTCLGTVLIEQLR